MSEVKQLSKNADKLSMLRTNLTLIILSFFIAHTGNAKLTQKELLSCQKNWRHVIDRYLVSHFKSLCINGLDTSLICGSVAGGAYEAGKALDSNGQKIERTAQKAAKQADEVDGAAKKVFQKTINQGTTQETKKAAGNAARKALMLQVEKVVASSILVGTSKLKPSWQRKLGKGITKIAGATGLTTGAGALMTIADADPTGCSELNHQYMVADANNYCAPVYKPGKPIINFLKLPQNRQKELLATDRNLCDYYTNLAKEFEKSSQNASLDDVKLTNAKCRLTQNQNDNLPFVYELNFQANYGGRGAGDYRIVNRGRTGGMSIQKAEGKKSGTQRQWQELYHIETASNENGEDSLDRISVFSNQFISETYSASGELLKAEKIEGPKKTYSISTLDPQRLREDPVLMNHIQKARSIFQLNQGYYKPVMNACCEESSERPQSCNILLGNSKNGRYEWDTQTSEQ